MGLLTAFISNFPAIPPSSGLKCRYANPSRRWDGYDEKRHVNVDAVVRENLGTNSRSKIAGQQSPGKQDQFTSMPGKDASTKLPQIICNAFIHESAEAYHLNPQTAGP
ncbi:hypothetical protein G7Y89_g7568 [Cudoniella acicularis]|uniref:Uncharacterized protein n=1 Tax=Cudoniella acicularis TaxID=354080 RepID=A0A8H4W3P1_9HELO|nr:hypothetical protein G7Y89_g7568 [Cudoniella acicularis]